MYDILNLDNLRAVGTRQAVNVGGYVLMFGCLFTAAVLFLGAFTGFDSIAVAALVFFSFGLAACAAGGYILFKTVGQTARVVERGLALLDAETKFRFAAPPALALPASTSTLPPSAETDSFVWNRGGEGEVVPKNLIAGFDPRFMNWMVDYITGKGNRWSEAVLENMPLPYEGGVFGKAEGNTPYQRLFEPSSGVLTKTGIIIGRGGAGNPTGKLGITDRVEIIRLLKGLA